MDLYERMKAQGISLTSPYATIYTLDVKKHKGVIYLWINGEAGYGLDSWTYETAIADYLSYDAYLRRMDFHYRAWGYYD